MPPPDDERRAPGATRSHLLSVRPRVPTRARPAPRDITDADAESARTCSVTEPTGPASLIANLPAARRRRYDCARPACPHDRTAHAQPVRREPVFTACLTPIARALAAARREPRRGHRWSARSACAPARWSSTRAASSSSGTVVITVFVFSDLIDGTMARMTGAVQPVGRVPRLDARPDRRRGDLRRAGAVVRRARRRHRLLAAVALFCLVGRRGGVVRQGPGRGARPDRRRRHRRARRAAADRAGRPPAWTGSACRTSRPSGCGLLAVASAVTLVQRMAVVRPPGASRPSRGTPDRERTAGRPAS